jgi:hypothetical protein
LISWSILRTRPAGRHRGRSIPIFIDNLQMHLTQLDVYDDGAVDAWGMLDLPLFERKLTTHWINLAPPDGAQLSVFNLGGGVISDGEWLHTKDELRESVYAIVRALNPSGHALVDMNGDDAEVRGKARYARLGLSDARPIRDDEVLGAPLPVFVPEGDEWRLTRWFVFADGMTRFGCEGEPLAFDDACDALRSGEVRTSVPDGSRLHIEGLGRCRVASGFWGVQPNERVREAADELAKLRGSDGAIEKCRNAHAAFEKDPSSQKRDELRAAYLAVPEHLRLFCGDMDSKDWPIRRILELD